MAKSLARNVLPITDTEFHKQAAKAVAIKKRMDADREALKSLQDRLLSRMRTMANGKVNFTLPVTGGAIIYKNIKGIEVSSVDAAREALGARFIDYFDEKCEIVPNTKRLKELISDGDDQQGLKMRDLTYLVEKETITVKAQL